MPDPKPSAADKIKAEAKKAGAEVKQELNKIPSTSDQNMLAALSYVWWLSIVLLLIKRNDEYVHFHAKQAVILTFLTIFWWIPILGQLLFVLAIIGMIVGFIQAWQGKRYQLPVVYGWSQKIHF